MTDDTPTTWPPTQQLPPQTQDTERGANNVLLAQARPTDGRRLTKPHPAAQQLPPQTQDTMASAEVTAKLRKVIEDTAPAATLAAFSRADTGAEVVTYTSGTRYLTLAEVMVAGYVVGWQLQEGNNAGGPDLANTSLVSWAFLLDEVEEALDTAEAAARRLVA